MNRIRTTLAVVALGVASLALVACDGVSANGGPEDVPTATSPGGTSGGDAPVGSGDPRPDGTGAPEPDDAFEDFERVETAAPIDEIDVLFLESFPVQHRLHVVSGLPSGCAKFERIEVERDGDTFNVSVVNTMPHPDAAVMCTMIYGMIEHTVDLGDDLDAGTEYTVNVNDEQITFVAQ
ncbi:MAG: hypothetical protein WD058_01265 [Dehalococcoidia bacterium]